MEHQLDIQRMQGFIDKGFNPSVIFDVGGAIGDFTSSIGTLFPSAEFHIFEPMVDHSSRYQEEIIPKVEGNPKWHLHKVAVGNSNKAINFYLHNSLTVGSTALQMKNHKDFTKVPSKMNDKEKESGQVTLKGVWLSCYEEFCKRIVESHFYNEETLTILLGNIIFQLQ